MRQALTIGLPFRIGAVTHRNFVRFGGKRNADGQGFAAFGRVIIGMDVVEAIQRAPVSKDPQDPKMLRQTLAPPIVIKKAYRKTTG